LHQALTWAIAAATIAGIIVRPRQWPEAVWACLGALLLVVCGLVSFSSATGAVLKGTDVYLFLTGMMLLADLARREGVFDWLAGLALQASGGSRSRLFLLIYLVGVLVTVFLSNDATAVVLTPAVYAAVKRARGDAQPYLFTCAMIANAASFVLPISNPANLVVYGKTLPPLLPWLRVFALPSLVSIAVTFLALRLFFRTSLRGTVEQAVVARATLTDAGRRAVWGIAFTGGVLIAASAAGRELGLPTCLAAAAAILVATRARLHAVAEICRAVSWSVLPLVAGLFVLVEGLNQAGAARGIAEALRDLATYPAWAAALAASFGIAMLSNVMNNLPSGLLAGSALQTAQVADHLRNAVLVGVDLGPNLSVTGSLATVLWLIALRREGYRIGGWTFLKCGLATMPVALLLATLALLV
jgi:arsenical pump membrane protein